ncbi:MAG TPA: hypothetical protein VGG39_33885 [Polyangiaceae bacterium]|jgi:hypothetical protein
MKSLLAVVLVAAGVLSVQPAFADPTVTVTLRMPERTILGRIDKPMVVIVMKTPTAASQAGAAHEALRASLMKQYEPAALKRVP